MRAGFSVCETIQFYCRAFLAENYGPGRIRAEKGAVDAGTVHANCAGQPARRV